MATTEDHDVHASTTRPPPPRRPATRRAPRGSLVLALAGALALAACGGDDSAERSVDAEFEQEAAREDVAGDQPAAAEGGQDGDDAVVDTGGDGEEADPGDPEAAIDRQLVYRATIGLASDDPDETVEQVEAAARDAGGFVAGTQLQRDDLDLLRGSITIRVPAANLDALLADVASTAEVTSRDQTVEDVTGQVADIEARLRNLRALEEELLVLLTEAREGGDTEDVLAVFDRVGQVREEIEVLEGRRDDIGDQVALSTLTVRVEPSRALVESRTSQPDEELPLPWSPGDVVATAWDATVAALRAFVDTAIRVVVFLVPVLLVWLSPVWLVLGLVLWWRRRRDGRAPTTDRRVVPEPGDGNGDGSAGGVPDDESEPPAAPRVGAGAGTERP